MGEPNQGHKLIQIHKMDGLHQGSRPQSTKWTDPTRVTNLYKSTKWTDPTRVTNLYKSTKWTNPTKGQDSSPQSGRTQPGSQTCTSSQSGRTPPRVKTIVHEVDGPGKGKKLKYPQSGWTKYQNSCPQHGRTQQGQNSSPQRGRTQLGSNLFK